MTQPGWYRLSFQVPAHYYEDGLSRCMRSFVPWDLDGPSTDPEELGWTCAECVRRLPK